MATAKKTSSCETSGHAYQLVPDADTREVLPDGRTGIYRTLYCSKCADTKVIQVSTWNKRKEDKF